jgi:hypothetical protein
MGEPEPRRESVWTAWRWPLVALFIFTATLFVANRFLDRISKPLAPSYTSTTIIQTSVSRLRNEAKLVVLSADVTVEVTKTSSKILFDRLDFGDTVATVRSRGNRAQYFVALDQIRESDFHVSGDGRNVTVTVPTPRVDESIVEVQTDPDQMEVKTEVGWGRLDKRSGELARTEAKRSMREAVISEAKTPVYMELARKNAQEKVSELLTPLVKQMGVTNLTVKFRKP